MKNTIIKCKDLIHVYSGKRENVVLNGISLNIHENEKVAIIGMSGSGKSTLLSIIGSLIIPTGGEIVVDGFNLNKLSLEEILKFRRDTVGFVFQKENLIDFLTVKENIELPLKFKDHSQDYINQRINELTERLGINRYLNSFPDELSGGESQRVSIAVALVNNPKIILADEPTGNLDEKTAIEVYNFLSDICSLFGTTLVIVSHDISINKYVDRVINLSLLKEDKKNN